MIADILVMTVRSPANRSVIDNLSATVALEVRPFPFYLNKQVISGDDRRVTSNL